MLAACGGSGGTVYAPFRPDRVIAFGDALTDMGQTGRRYTVNDGSVNNWAQQFAMSNGCTLDTSANGGLNFAHAHARVTDTPDAVGNASTPTILKQIDQFLTNNTFQTGDVVLVNGGISDIIAGMPSVLSGYTSSVYYIQAMGAAGKALAEQVRRLVKSGAQKVVVLGLMNMGRSPWAWQIGQTQLLNDASTKFNEQLLVNMTDLGTNVLYIDVAYYLNLLTGAPSAYGIASAVDIACTSYDTGVGIGIGLNEVNSGICDTTTVNANILYTRLLFADNVYFTPLGHVQLGNYVFTRVRTRW